MGTSRPGEKRPVTRPMTRGADNVSTDVQNLGVVAGRVQWLDSVISVMSLRGAVK